MASYCVTNFTQMLLQEQSDEHTLERLPRKTLQSLFQLPFSLTEQLLADIQES